MDTPHGHCLSVYEKKIDGKCTIILRALLNKSWMQHPIKQQLYGHLPPISKPIQIRRTRHVGYCWRNKDELISDVLLWTPSHERASAGQPARTYLQQLCRDTEDSSVRTQKTALFGQQLCTDIEDQSEVMDDGDEWRERVREFRASGTTR